MPLGSASAVACCVAAGGAAVGCWRTTAPPLLSFGTRTASAPPVVFVVSPATFLPVSGTASMTSLSASTDRPSGSLADNASSLLPVGMGLLGRMTHSPFSSAVPVPITRPLLVTVTSLPEAARPAITSAPAGSTRTTSNEGAAASGCDAGFAAAAACVSVDGGTAACCVAVGAVDAAAAVVAAAATAVLSETEGVAASGVTLADPVPTVAPLVAGADVEAVPACAAPTWAAPALVVAAVF